MSTTSLTPDGSRPSYTIVGQRGAPKITTMPAVILLNRSSRLLRRDYIAAIVNEGYTDVISVELRENSYSVESLSTEFPQVRFLLLDTPLNEGARINLAMSLTNAETVLVMWSTMELPGGITRALDQIRNMKRVICLAPALRGERGEALPVVQVPAMQRRSLRIMTLPIRGTAVDTLFPFDYIGLYHRKRFLQLGMFDEEIQRPHWQKLDFGFRCAMWGESIRTEPTFRMSYRSMPDPEDQTAAQGYARFFARNLAVRLRDTGPSVTRLQAIPFAFRAQWGIVEAIRTFSEAARWVEDNRERFSRDAGTVVREWSMDHG